ncbi:alpha/beta fold hydrolase [Streptomyces flavofungini]|uniref:alpha/beta fold hydrolase n=1 Tax=Streptomyces flavofungini TaxID=68200 RepID=UPI0034DF2FD4
MDIMVPVKDGEVWAWDSGVPRGVDAGGLPLVLLHPGVADSRIWDGVLPRLTARHRVIRYDARAYGRSPDPTAPFSLVADLTAVLGHFGIARAVLAGSSMGAATAISLALRDPARVAALALVVPGVTGADELLPRAFMAEVGRLAEAGDIDGIVAMIMRSSAAAGTGDDAEVAAFVKAVVPAWFAVPRQRDDGAPHPGLPPRAPRGLRPLPDAAGAGRGGRRRPGGVRGGGRGGMRRR